MIQRPGEAPAPIDVGAGLTVGGGEGDGVRVAGLEASALVLHAAGAGMVVEARAPGALVDRSPLAPGRRRLLAGGERIRVADVVLWTEPPAAPDGTRALAGAILAGDPVLPGPRLLVLEGPSAGAALALADGAILGRGRGASLALADALASRRHAMLTLHGGRARLRDLSSKNGISVNGRRVGRAGVALRAGDALVVGESVLVYEEGPAATDLGGDARGRGARGVEPPPARPRERPTRLVAGVAMAALVAAALLLAVAAV